MTKYGERLLKAQGWRGKGNSLHPTDNSIGLSNPLRISRNTDGRGIGQSTHYTSDQWWLAAFDEKLKGLDTSKDGKVVQTTTQSKLDAVTANIGGGKYTGAGGLYASFVRGEGLAGTLDNDNQEDSGSGSTPGGSEREDVAGLKKGVSKKREEKRRLKQMEKEEKKRRKAMEKLKKKEEKKAAKKAAKKEEKEKRKEESKEERKKRKLERRAKKEEKRRSRKEENGKEKKA
ncbi:hypothetical protein B0T20DRAFT_88966 [Sordaria brevicollis]|uniref:G-patch domain-containing protein n=1 Tax=Sordaria brevicollis TaxID=83679 RepID=A0AAE0NWD0_SORBR|nr:hypothetical protein B0T20DRAFT_88966 [Sordaria brevicollis]